MASETRFGSQTVTTTAGLPGNSARPGARPPGRARSRRRRPGSAAWPWLVHARPPPRRRRHPFWMMRPDAGCRKVFGDRKETVMASRTRTARGARLQAPRVPRRDHRRAGAPEGERHRPRDRRAGRLQGRRGRRRGRAPEQPHRGGGDRGRQHRRRADRARHRGRGGHGRGSPGRRRSRRGRRLRVLRRGRLGRARGHPQRLGRRADPARAPLGGPAPRRRAARRRVPHRRRVHQPARPRRDRHDRRPRKRSSTTPWRRPPQPRAEEAHMFGARRVARRTGRRTARRVSRRR